MSRDSGRLSSVIRENFEVCIMPVFRRHCPATSSTLRSITTSDLNFHPPLLPLMQTKGDDDLLCSLAYTRPDSLIYRSARSRINVLGLDILQICRVRLGRPGQVWGHWPSQVWVYQCTAGWGHNRERQYK